MRLCNIITVQAFHVFHQSGLGILVGVNVLLTIDWPNLGLSATQNRPSDRRSCVRFLEGKKVQLLPVARCNTTTDKLHTCISTLILLLQCQQAGKGALGRMLSRIGVHQTCIESHCSGTNVLETEVLKNDAFYWWSKTTFLFLHFPEFCQHPHHISTKKMQKIRICHQLSDQNLSFSLSLYSGMHVAVLGSGRHENDQLWNRGLLFKKFEPSGFLGKWSAPMSTPPALV